MLKHVLLFLGGNFKLIVKIFIEAQKPQNKKISKEDRYMQCTRAQLPRRSFHMQNRILKKKNSFALELT